MWLFKEEGGRCSVRCVRRTVLRCMKVKVTVYNQVDVECSGKPTAWARRRSLHVGIKNSD
eukprot:6467469-Amphidinium_carterae.3